MLITEESKQDALVLRIEGKVDSNTADEFSEKLIAACHRSNRVRLDLSRVPYFSSAGLRGLIMGSKVSGLKGGTMEIFGVNESLAKILQDTGLDQSLNIITESGKVLGREEEEENGPEEKAVKRRSDSLDWINALPAARGNDQILIVAVHEKTTAWVSLHEREGDGSLRMTVSTVGFIGKDGLSYGEEKGPGGGKTPAGSFNFDRKLFLGLSDREPFTDGRISIPEEKLNHICYRVRENCIVVIDTLERLGRSF